MPTRGVFTTCHIRKWRCGSSDTNPEPHFGQGLGTYQMRCHGVPCSALPGRALPSPSMAHGAIPFRADGLVVTPVIVPWLPEADGQRGASVQIPEVEDPGAFMLSPF